MDSEKTRSSKDRVTPYEKPYVDVIGFTYQDIIRTSTPCEKVECVLRIGPPSEW